MRTPATAFPWLRYWFRQGERPSLADDYLMPPNQQTAWYSASQTTTLKTLPRLADVPCLVLLGDPGKGKTNEIRAEFQRLADASPAGVKVKLLNLKSHSAAWIEKVVFDRDEFIDWTEGRHALVLFFASMDECWRRVPELSDGLRCGIDVAAHFNCASWAGADDRKSKALSGKSLSEVTDILAAEHRRLAATTTKPLDLVVLDAGV